MFDSKDCEEKPKKYTPPEWIFFGKDEIPIRRSEIKMISIEAKHTGWCVRIHLTENWKMDLLCDSKKEAKIVLKNCSNKLCGT